MEGFHRGPMLFERVKGLRKNKGRRVESCRNRLIPQEAVTKTVSHPAHLSTRSNITETTLIYFNPMQSHQV
jgi:hypothetical protein